MPGLKKEIRECNFSRHVSIVARPDSFYIEVDSESMKPNGTNTKRNAVSLIVKEHVYGHISTAVPLEKNYLDFD